MCGRVVFGGGQGALKNGVFERRRKRGRSAGFVTKCDVVQFRGPFEAGELGLETSELGLLQKNTIHTKIYDPYFNSLKTL